MRAAQLLADPDFVSRLAELEAAGGVIGVYSDAAVAARLGITPAAWRTIRVTRGWGAGDKRNHAGRPSPKDRWDARLREAGLDGVEAFRRLPLREIAAALGITFQRAGQVRALLGIDPPGGKRVSYD